MAYQNITQGAKDLEEFAKHLIMEPNDATITFAQLFFCILVLLMFRCVCRTSTWPPRLQAE